MFKVNIYLSCQSDNNTTFLTPNKTNMKRITSFFLLSFGFACLFNLPACYNSTTSANIPTEDKPRIINKLFVDNRGFISVQYTAKDGEQYAFDYMEPGEFAETFGFEIQSQPSDFQLTTLSQDSMQLRRGDSTLGKVFLTDDSEIGYLIIHGNK